MAKLRNLVLLALGCNGVIAGATKSVPARTFGQCQRKTANPLDGCPDGTIYVSQIDKRAKFQSIQGAISSLRNDTTSHVILIAPGIYTEQLNVTRQGPLTLLGVSDRPVRGEPYADISYEAPHANDVQIYWNSANHDAIFPDNVYTGVLTVGPNLNATLTGSGPTGFPVPGDTPFGCTDFRAYNIDFRNEYAPYSNGPAHAVGISRANAGFYSCGFYSWQDTVYIGKLGNAYFYDSVVAGQTDFLYGFGTLFIDSSSLSLRNCGGGITAWKGTNTTFANKYGVYISDSQLLAANSSIAPIITDKCSLGRPWNALHRSLFMNTYFDASVLPAGYTQWAGQPNGNFGVNTTMAVYKVNGPGYDEEAERANNITAVFTAKEAKPYLRPVDVFMTPEGKQPNIKWIDPSVLFSASTRFVSYSINLTSRKRM
ncbi:putative pectinesterase [Rosellinia necatrix]|uniref:pectinesterase n=1 Tax=Rosellinia necatrix TaxID=77044 RepID=A0A1W2TGE1_ROSNE|nr:putative pectinesterase [Rosellinia necatrix]